MPDEPLGQGVGHGQGSVRVEHMNDRAQPNGLGAGLKERARGPQQDTPNEAATAREERVERVEVANVLDALRDVARVDGVGARLAPRLRHGAQQPRRARQDWPLGARNPGHDAPRRQECRQRPS